MKRSKRAGLALMGVTPFLLTACSDEPPTPPQFAFNTVEECTNSKTFTPEVCKAEYDKAVEAHQAQAPRFTTQSACETQFGSGNCQTMRGSDGFTSWFVPAFAGFMLGQVLADRPRDDRHYTGGGGYGGSSYGYYRSEPLYRDRDNRGGWRTPDNSSVSRSSGSSPAVTQSRGGFGSQASARGSWGS